MAYDYNSGLVKISGAIPVGVPIAQGDILLVRCESIPEDAKPMKVGQTGNESVYSGNRAILAYGEATGHAHVLEIIDPTTTTLECFEKDGTMYMKVSGGPAALKHEEHAHIEVPPANYTRILQREWDQWSESRRMAD